MDTLEKIVVQIPVGKLELSGELILPDNASGIIIFSHGSGSSRMSPRNQYVAQVLQQAGFATLLFDLLTDEEAEIVANRFNIHLLSKRLLEATDWTFRKSPVAGLPIGYFGASTGAASAIKVAASLGKSVKAVVSRGGRPDLALPELSLLAVPVLLIVGGEDGEVMHLNEDALKMIHAPKQLVVIEGATHLFEEPGKLEEVAITASKWFKKYLLI